MRVLSSLLLAVTLLNVGLTSYAETQVDETLKSGYNYVNLSSQSKLEATSLLMLNNNETKEQAPVATPQKLDTPRCMVSNKQFVHCSR